MDSFNNISSITGSRCPILIPAITDNSSTSSHTPTPPSTVTSNTSTVSILRSRRKPAYVFKSPSADEPGEWGAHTSAHQRAPPSYDRVAQRRASTDTDTTRSSSNQSSAAICVTTQRNPPLLSLYHPLGTLAQSLPKLDPSVFGLPGSLDIEDPDGQGEADSARSLSRVRRGAPKAREAGDDESQAGTPSGTSNTAQDTSARERNPSPRKRRGGGAKRKRKDADDVDAVFPPPAKRTRNPRGTAANSSAPAAPSPLVGPAVVASDLVDDVPDNTGEGQQEAQEEVQAPKRSSRARKPRRPAKRRDSSGSASTATSVSISIAVTAKAAAHAKATVTHDQAEDETTHLRPEGVNGVVQPQEDGTMNDVAGRSTPVPKEVAPPEVSQMTPGSDSPAKLVQTEGEPEDTAMRDVTPMPVIPPSAPAPPLPQTEEREEGELSDD